MMERRLYELDRASAHPISVSVSSSGSTNNNNPQQQQQALSIVSSTVASTAAIPMIIQQSNNTRGNNPITSTGLVTTTTLHSHPPPQFDSSTNTPASASSSGDIIASGTAPGLNNTTGGTTSYTTWQPQGLAPAGTYESNAPATHMYYPTHEIFTSTGQVRGQIVESSAQHLGNKSTTATIIAAPATNSNATTTTIHQHDLNAPQHHHHHHHHPHHQLPHQQHQQHHHQQQQHHHQQLANTSNIIVSNGTTLVVSSHALGAGGGGGGGVALQMATNVGGHGGTGATIAGLGAPPSALQLGAAAGSNIMHGPQSTDPSSSSAAPQVVVHGPPPTAGSASVSSLNPKRKKRPVKTKKKQTKEDELAESLDSSVYPDDLLYIRAPQSSNLLGCRHTVNINTSHQHDPKAMKLLCPRPQTFHTTSSSNNRARNNNTNNNSTSDGGADSDDEFHTLAGVGVWEYGKLWNHHLTIKFLENLHKNKKRMFSRDSRKLLYMELSNMFQEEDNKEITTEEIEKKWCSLLSSYKRNQNRIKTGEEVSWGYYKIMDEIMTEGKQIRRQNRERPKRYSKQRSKLSEDELDMRNTKATCKRKSKKLKRLLMERLESVKHEREESLAEAKDTWAIVKETVNCVNRNITMLNSSVVMLEHTMTNFLSTLENMHSTKQSSSSLYDM